MQYSDRFDSLKCCVIIPTYNNAGSLKKVLNDVLVYTNRVIVIDDGSTDNTPCILDEYPQISQIRFKSNCGKGYALRKGFEKARELGFSHAISLDSDGQHFADDLPAFLDALEKDPGTLFVGARNMQDAGAPGKSNFGLRFSNFWYTVTTGIRLPDTQSGYRLYPVEKLAPISFVTRRFEFEVEVLVRAAWRKIPVRAIPVKVYYPPAAERISHFRPFADFFRISVLNTVLVLLALLFFRPYLFVTQFSWHRFKAVLRREIFNPSESNAVKVASVMVGAFMGVAPVWGWQMAIALGIAVAFRLNKVIVLAVSNISIPPMIPFILYLSFISGGFVLGKGAALPFTRDIDLQFVTQNLFQYVIGALVFGLALAIVFGMVTYLLLHFFRKPPVAAQGKGEAG